MSTSKHFFSREVFPKDILNNVSTCNTPDETILLSFLFQKLKDCLGLCVNCDGLCMQSTVDKMSEFIIRAPRRYELRNRRDVASSFLHCSFLDCTHTVPSDSDLESESSANCLMTRVSRDQLGPFQFQW